MMFMFRGTLQTLLSKATYNTNYTLTKNWLKVSNSNKPICLPTYPRLRVAVACPDDASSLLNHLQDGTTVNIPHDIGIIRPHDPKG